MACEINEGKKTSASTKVISFWAVQNSQGHVLTSPGSNWLLVPIVNKEGGKKKDFFA
jgi:hypothetical protein